MTLEERQKAAREVAKWKVRDVEAAYENKWLTNEEVVTPTTIEPVSTVEAPKTMWEIDPATARKTVAPPAITPPVPVDVPKITPAPSPVKTEAPKTTTKTEEVIVQPDWTIQWKMNEMAKANPYLSTEQIVSKVKDEVWYNAKDDEVYNQFFFRVSPRKTSWRCSKL